MKLSNTHKSILAGIFAVIILEIFDRLIPGESTGPHQTIFFRVLCWLFVFILFSCATYADLEKKSISFLKNFLPYWRFRKISRITYGIIIIIALLTATFLLKSSMDWKDSIIIILSVVFGFVFLVVILENKYHIFVKKRIR